MTRVLVPVRILEGSSVSPGLMNLLATVDVTVLGYHVLPEQTPPDQARAQYEDRANSALDDIAQEFRTAGGDADHRLVFTRDRRQTIERVADEVNARAYGITGATGDVDSLLVSLTGDVALDRIVAFVEEVVGDRDIRVTLFAADEDTEKAEEKVEWAREKLEDAGVDVDSVVAEGSGFRVLVDAASGHDVVVVGEKAPSLKSLVFGDEMEKVAEASVGPVLVVRYDDYLDG